MNPEFEKLMLSLEKFYSGQGTQTLFALTAIDAKIIVDHVRELKADLQFANMELDNLEDDI